MTSDERLSLIRLKVERAKKHFSDLEVVLNRFMNSKPYEIRMESDSHSGNNIYRIFDIQTPMAEFGLITGDVIHCLRSSLDHLAYQLVLANSNIPTKQTTFPIFEDSTKYTTGLSGKVTGMSQRAIDTINVTEPYQGGKGTGLWVLHYLDIADKHHMLLTPLFNVTEVSFTIPSFLEPDYRGAGNVSFPNFKKPLKNGDVIATRQTEMDKDMNLAIDIVLTEPDVIKSKPVIKTLCHLIELVESTVVSFRNLL
jgi:hypothetical protein